MKELLHRCLEYIESRPSEEESKNNDTRTYCISWLKRSVHGFDADDKEAHHLFDFILLTICQHEQNIVGLKQDIESLLSLHGIDHEQHRAVRGRCVSCDASKYRSPSKARSVKSGVTGNALGLNLRGEDSDASLMRKGNSDNSIDVSPNFSPFTVSSNSSPQPFQGALETHHGQEIHSKGENIASSDKPKKWTQQVPVLREIAQNAYIQMEEERQRFQAFRKAGLVNEAKRSQTIVRNLSDVQIHYNGLAEKISFNNLNFHYYRSDTDSTITGQQLSGPRQNLAEIELHGLHIREALRNVKEHIAFCRISGVKRTRLICGQGHFSEDGVSKLKPALLKALSRVPGIEVRELEQNPGRLVMRISESDPIAAAIGKTAEQTNAKIRQKEVG